MHEGGRGDRCASSTICAFATRYSSDICWRSLAVIGVAVRELAISRCDRSAVRSRRSVATCRRSASSSICATRRAALIHARSMSSASQAAVNQLRADTTASLATERAATAGCGTRISAGLLAAFAGDLRARTRCRSGPRNQIPGCRAMRVLERSQSLAAQIDGGATANSSCWRSLRAFDASAKPVSVPHRRRHRQRRARSRDHACEGRGGRRLRPLG